MKILYLHGLDSHPREDKVEILESRSEVVAPKIDYREYESNISLFEELTVFVGKERITNIVGSSFGGYIGFYLSEFSEIPAVLFNPAISFKTVSVPVMKVFSDVEKTLILGKDDDEIIPEKTIKFIEENDYKNTQIVKEDFGHSVPLEIFSLAMDYLKEKGE